ncbi:MAG: glycosyltransferase family 9 protein [Bacteroidota bacterium]
MATDFFNTEKESALKNRPKRILVIQPAFMGDVVLATSLAETLHKTFPSAAISFLLKKGNEMLLKGHPFLEEVHVWDKGKSRYLNLLRLAKTIRSRNYDLVVNVQRFFSSGLLTTLSGAKETRGFKKNPLSRLFSQSFAHETNSGIHEIVRNHQLIADLCGPEPAMPRLYLLPADTERVKPYQNEPYVCIAPGSVWFTKTFPAAKWLELIARIPGRYKIYLIGGPAEILLCDELAAASGGRCMNLAKEKLSLLQSAALMAGAVMNYVNDSGPMHLCSALGAPVTAVYCSTVPAFGFGPLSPVSHIVQIKEKLDCRPCGLHGHATCPLGHFSCAHEIDVSDFAGLEG